MREEEEYINKCTLLSEVISQVDSHQHLLTGEWGTGHTYIHNEILFVASALKKTYFVQSSVRTSQVCCL